MAEVLSCKIRINSRSEAVMAKKQVRFLKSDEKLKKFVEVTI